MLSKVMIHPIIFLEIFTYTAVHHNHSKEYLFFVCPQAAVISLAGTTRCITTFLHQNNSLQIYIFAY